MRSPPTSAFLEFFLGTDGDNSHQLEWKTHLFMPELTLFSSTCKHKAEDQHPHSELKFHTFVRSLFLMRGTAVVNQDVGWCVLRDIQYTTDTVPYLSKKKKSTPSVHLKDLFGIIKTYGIFRG